MVQLARCKMFGIPIFLEEKAKGQKGRGTGPFYAFDQSDMPYFRALMAAEMLMFAEHGLLLRKDSN